MDVMAPHCLEPDLWNIHWGVDTKLAAASAVRDGGPVTIADLRIADVVGERRRFKKG